MAQLEVGYLGGFWGEGGDSCWWWAIMYRIGGHGRIGIEVLETKRVDVAACGCTYLHKTKI